MQGARRGASSNDAKCRDDVAEARIVDDVRRIQRSNRAKATRLRAVSLSLASLASLFVSLATGCIDGGIVTLRGAADAGDDSASAPPAVDAGDEQVASDTCGAGPYVTLGILVKGATLDNSNPPLPGAKFTTPLCPGKYTLSDDGGRLSGHITKGAAFYGRFEAAHYTNTLTPELRFAVDVKDYEVLIPPTIFAALVPDFGPGKTAILVGTKGNGGSGECAKYDGIAFRVVGHPEAAVTYYSTDAVPAPVDGATATTASGRAAISGLAAGEPVVLEATKAGCTVTMKRGEFTGRAPLEAGWLTLIAAYVGD